LDWSFVTTFKVEVVHVLLQLEAVTGDLTTALMSILLNEGSGSKISVGPET
jgi:hypothetical protein